MELPRIRRGTWVPITHKIGIVGVSNSGKTVLLTSLIHHLKQHNRQRFPLSLKSLGGEVDIRYAGDLEENLLPIDRIMEGKARDAGEDPAPDRPDIDMETVRFPYEMYRDAMTRDGDWPTKTVSFSRFGCRVDLQGATGKKPCSMRKIWLYDIPGERLADIQMARCRSYEEWSDRILTDFYSNGRVRDYVTGFLLALTTRKGLDAEQAILLYKTFLLRCYKECMETISPSVFRLDTKGGELHLGRSDTQILAERFSGLGPGREFAPLSKEARNSNPEVTARFAAHYREYRNKIVYPLLTVLGSCDGLVLLVDLVDILRGGIAAFVDNQQLLGRVFDFLNDRGLMTRLFRAATWRRNLKNAAIAAPKIDLFSTGDVESDRPRLLLEHFMRDPRARTNTGGIHCECFQCCAAKAAITTSEDERTYQLQGYSEDAPEMMSTFERGRRLPEQWPSEWKPGEYRFPDVRPKLSPNPLYPPKQEFLDKVFAFALEGPQ
jgi:uncharacterized protein